MLRGGILLRTTHLNKVLLDGCPEAVDWSDWWRKTPVANVLSYIENPRLRQAHGRYARQYVKKHFAWEKIFRDLAYILDEAGCERLGAQ
jgi:hypothetical protein